MNFLSVLEVLHEVLLFTYQWLPSPLVETTLGRGYPSEPPSTENAKAKRILAFCHCPRRLLHPSLCTAQLEVEGLLLVCNASDPPGAAYYFESKQLHTARVYGSPDEPGMVHLFSLNNHLPQRIGSDFLFPIGEFHGRFVLRSQEIASLDGIKRVLRNVRLLLGAWNSSGQWKSTTAFRRPQSMALRVVMDLSSAVRPLSMFPLAVHPTSHVSRRLIPNKSR